MHFLNHINYIHTHTLRSSGHLIYLISTLGSVICLIQFTLDIQVLWYGTVAGSKILLSTMDWQFIFVPYFLSKCLLASCSFNLFIQWYDKLQHKNIYTVSCKKSGSFHPSDISTRVSRSGFLPDTRSGHDVFGHGERVEKSLSADPRHDLWSSEPVL